MPSRPQLYFDHNATTPLRSDLRETYAALLAEGLGNPSSLHAAGRRARALIDEARERLAAALEVGEEELVFTSGGTESDNLALLGASRALGGGVACAPTEHAAVLEAAARAEAEGRPSVALGVHPDGRVDLDSVRAAAERSTVAVISVAGANGEVGSLASLEEVVGAARDGGGAWIHTDAVQALGRVPLRLASSGVDLAALSAHKVGGPVGVGVLYVRTGVQLQPLLFGGGQESGLRPGTENAAAVSVAAHAIERAVAERETLAARVSELTRWMAAELRRRVPAIRTTGPAPERDDRLPNTLNLTLPGVDGRILITRLDLQGLQVSSGSACASGSAEPSHVLLALGHDAESARASVRLSLGRDTSREECQQAVEILVKTCAGEHASSDDGGRL